MTLSTTNTAIAQIPANLDAPVARDVLTQAEYEAFRDTLPNWRDRLIAMILRNTGLRINEVLALEVRHCAFDGPASIIYVQRSKKRRNAEFERYLHQPGPRRPAPRLHQGPADGADAPGVRELWHFPGIPQDNGPGPALRLREGRHRVNRPAGSTQGVPELLCPDDGGRWSPYGHGVQNEGELLGREYRYE